jgi:hypothetical protein
MSSNNRIFYACQGVAITKMGNDAPVTTDMVEGLQSVGMTTNFNLEQAFSLGQLEIYENIEGTPDVEVTLEKVLDGQRLLYHMATTGVQGESSSGLANRSKQRTDIRLGIFDEGQNNLKGQTPEVEVYCSGMYVSSISYSVPTDGNATESVTLVGNEKQWLTDARRAIGSDDVVNFDGQLTPLASGMGGVQRREDLMLSGCALPVGIKGVEGSGVGNGINMKTGAPRVHLQSISVSTDFSREEVLELGRKVPYYRPANFPIEVSCEIEAITTSGDFIGAYETGDPALYNNPVTSGNNSGEEAIFIAMRCGYGFDLGKKNRLSSVSYGGGDAGGGNASTTYSYTNFNELDVQQGLKASLPWAHLNAEMDTTTFKTDYGHLAGSISSS